MAEIVDAVVDDVGSVDVAGVEWWLVYGLASRSVFVTEKARIGCFWGCCTKQGPLEKL